jgi:signal transduction histidine kinase
LRPREADKAPVDIRACAIASLDALEHLAQSTGVVFSLVGSESGLRIHGNAEHLVRALINLLTNACHAARACAKPESAPLRIVHLSYRRVAQSLVEVRVEDSGTGIPLEQRAQVFAPFFTTKTNSDGTGLGLAIVDGIVEEHAGTIAIEDAAIGGAAFVMTFPLIAPAP